MEYLGGGELRWRNPNHEPVLTVWQTRRICRDVLLGLEYRKSCSRFYAICRRLSVVHYQGIIHRDIKPANLVWDANRTTVKITDFGVSHFSYAQRLSAAGGTRVQADDPYDPILLDDSDLTQRAGTPFYLAPEVVWTDWEEDPYTKPIERPKITSQIDVWAFGITLFSLLEGRTPFTIPENRPQHEFQIYRIACTEDWDMPPAMGYDGLPTGGRHPTDRDTEGHTVVTLLDSLLQKDPTKRITVSELKVGIMIVFILPLHLLTVETSSFSELQMVS
jgi:serine/threonine protein kinase